MQAMERKKGFHFEIVKNFIENNLIFLHLFWAFKRIYVYISPKMNTVIKLVWTSQGISVSTKAQTKYKTYEQTNQIRWEL